MYFNPHSEHAGHEPWPVSDGVWCVCPLPGQRGPQWSPPPDPGQQLVTGLRPEPVHTLLLKGSGEKEGSVRSSSPRQLLYYVCKANVHVKF